MIKINNDKYDNYDIKITYGKFNIVKFDEKLSGVSPFIMFNVGDNIFLGIETVIYKDILENIKLKEKKDLTCYLTDITYEDEKGWISFINEKYYFYITKISDFDFKVDFSLETLDEINVKIDCDIELIYQE